MIAPAIFALGLLNKPGEAADLGTASDLLFVHPEAFTLHGQTAGQQIVVTATRGPQQRDVTSEVQFHSATPDIVSVDRYGVVRPVGDGSGRIVARLEGFEAAADVVVTQSDEPLPVSFELDVQPILAASGCSAGACHGKADGQNGFQLSLLGFDPEFDYAALTREARGRRIFPAAPERSLLLRKGTAEVPHGGGQRLDVAEDNYATILRWIEAGMPRHVDGQPELERITMWPTERLMRPEEEQQLVVTAHYSDGSTRDVTSQTTFQSNESTIVAVDEEGLVRAGTIPGEAAIMARYMESFATCRVAIPLPERVDEQRYAELPETNFIDRLVWEKLQSLRITPSEPTDDATFLRRAHLDLIGRLPTADEVRDFLADSGSDKRARLIDRLLERPEYADHWANKWADLLRPNPYRVGIKAVLNYDDWIRDSFRQNKPYDQFVRELITARGSTWHHGATTMYRDRRSPDELATLVSQLFLGVRLECAKCHHHPSETWSQEDFYSFAAYFARVGRKGTGLSPPISGGEEMILTARRGSVEHPLTGEVLPPRPLYGSHAPVDDGEDPREALARWMTSDENDFFAQTIVNRVWAELMGPGLVEPVDDLRATNPPSNEPLLDALVEHFRKVDYDLKELLRTIATSQVYALSSEPTPENVSDTRNYSRHYRQRLRAEVLLDAVTDITGVQESYPAMPAASRANQIWTHRVSSVFLDTFGRPDANQDPPCERTGESTVTQALHLMNSPNLHAKITSDGSYAGQLDASILTDDYIIEELYLRIYSRFPYEEERDIGRRWFAESENRRQAVEDLMWALMNTAEFVYRN